MFKSFKELFGKGKKSRKIDGLNLIYPPLSFSEKSNVACLVIFGTLVDLGVLKDNHNSYEDFSEVFYDSINNREYDMLDYFKQIELLDNEYFNDIQVSEAIKTWKRMNLLLPIESQEVETDEYLFAVKVIYDTLVSKKYAVDNKESHLKVCKAITDLPTNDGDKYPLLTALISIPESTDNESKLNRALKIYVRIQDEQRKLKEEFERDELYV